MSSEKKKNRGASRIGLDWTTDADEPKKPEVKKKGFSLSSLLEDVFATSYDDKTARVQKAVARQNKKSK